MLRVIDSDHSSSIEGITKSTISSLCSMFGIENSMIESVVVTMLGI